jgi:hypothetical protein
VDRAWQAFLRRFDIEHTFRFLKQALGWTRPKLRDPAAADRWTWLILACYAQLCLARHLAADIRLPWQRPCPDGRLTPARVRRGFRNIRQTLPELASAPKPGKPGPGRPPGSKNRRPATRHDVGKTVKRDQPKKESRRQTGSLAELGNDPGRFLVSEGPHGLDPDIAERGERQHRGCRGLIVGELGHHDDVVLAERVQVFPELAAAALDQGAEGLSALESIADVLDALVGPVRQDHVTAHRWLTS